MHNKVYIVFGSVLIFATVYYMLGPNHFHTYADDQFRPIDALYMSSMVQTTVGLGNVYPESALAKGLVSLQALTTLYLLGSTLFH